MKKPKFTYVTDSTSYHGYLEIYEGECKYKSENIFYFTEESDLLEFLKKNPDNINAVVVLDESKKILKEGERLSKKLNLQFIHP